MTREATCFRCRHVLRVSPDAQDRWLTCPRCLASVGNPFVLLPTEPPPAAVAPPPAAPPEIPPLTRSCPACGREVDPRWRICPHCEQPLRSREPSPPRPSVDAEARRDGRGSSVVALVLGGLLIVGSVLFVVIGGPVMVQSATDPGAVLFVGFLAIGAFVGGLVVLAFGARNQAVTTASGVLGGLAVGAGVVGLVVLVACLTVLAAIANFMHTCGCK